MVREAIGKSYLNVIDNIRYQIKEEVRCIDL